MFNFISRGKQFHEALEMLAAFKRGLCGGVKIKLGRLQVCSLCFLVVISCFPTYYKTSLNLFVLTLIFM